MTSDDDDEEEYMLKMNTFVIWSNENGFKFYMNTDEDTNCLGLSNDLSLLCSYKILY